MESQRLNIACAAQLIELFNFVPRHSYISSWVLGSGIKYLKIGGQNLYGRISVHDATDCFPIQINPCHGPPVFRYFMPNPSTRQLTAAQSKPLMTQSDWLNI